MDCSGAIYYIQHESGLKDALRPGDLLFWTGTYSADRDPPVTHTMIYLGKRKRDGKQVMFGASDGRTYDGRKIWGVSVYDFSIPKAKPAPSAGESVTPGSVFIGCANIPGLAQSIK